MRLRVSLLGISVTGSPAEHDYKDLSLLFLHGQGGSNREARRRRAAIHAAGQAGAELSDASSEDSSSGEEGGDVDSDGDGSPSSSKARQAGLGKML